MEATVRVFEGFFNRNFLNGSLYSSKEEVLEGRRVPSLVKAMC